MRICPMCGEENADRAQFCQACSAPLAAVSRPAREVRKTVTVVFTDLTGSTSLGERLDPESLRRLMGLYFDRMREVLKRHGGTVEKFIGDAIMAVFGIPTLHEDDALRAVRAAQEMREELDRLNAELWRDFNVTVQTRTGVNTGEVVAGDTKQGQTLVTGDPVNTAARLEQAASPGEVLIGEATYRLVRDAVKVEPGESIPAKGKAKPVSAYSLLKVTPGVAGFARRLTSPMVGRDREIHLLLEAFDRAVRGHACHLVTAVGEAGIGKSRLASEFIRAMEGRATVLRGRCLPYGEGITYWPIAEVVRQAAGISDDHSPADAGERIAALLEHHQQANRVASMVAALLGLTEVTRTPEEGFWSIRAFFEHMARARPLVLVFEDIHWGEETFLDLLDYVVVSTRDAPILMLCLARTDLLDRRPGWAAVRMAAEVLALEPLGGSESQTLLSNILGTDEGARAVTATIADAAEGNPLFLEEMISMLIDDGLLAREEGHWVATSDVTSVSVPPTVSALLTARLERLDEQERRILEHASVEGEVFYWEALSELCPPETRSQLGTGLMSLVRKELIRPAPSDFAGEDAFRFRHILIRDAVYDAMPKEARADLHERFSEWLERSAAERLGEVEEIVGYHLEQALRYREQLGRLTEQAADLGHRAAQHLGEAGRRALDRGDMRAAANLLGRAVTLLPPGDRSRPSLMLTLVDALREVGEFQQADALAAEGEEVARSLGDRGLTARLQLRRVNLRINLDPTTPMRETMEAARTIAGLQAELGERKAHFEALVVTGKCLLDMGQRVEGERILVEAQRHAGAGGWVATQAAIELVPSYSSQGPRPVPQEMARGEEMLAVSEDRSPLQAHALLGIAVHEAMQGKFDIARSRVDRASGIFRDLGMAVELAAAPGLAGALVEMLAGDADAAERALRPGYEALVQMGEKGRLSDRAALLARVVYEQGRHDEALALVDVAESSAARDDMEPQIWLRSVRAKVLAHRGDLADAERLARENVARAEETDWLDFQGTAWMDLAEVLRLAGRPIDLVDAARVAAERFEQKGDLVMADRARALLAEAQRARG